MSDYIVTLANALAGAVDANDVQLVLTHSTPEQRTFVASVAELLLEFLAPKEAALKDRNMFLSEVLSEADRLGHHGLKGALEGLWALDIGHGASPTVAQDATAGPVLRRCAELLVRVYVLGREGEWNSPSLPCSRALQRRGVGG